jgi:uncharacterized membrane protein YfcA
LLRGVANLNVSGAICAGGGIGGGGFYLPVFILILSLAPQEAVPLSKVTIFGVALGGYLVNFRKRHPDADRPLIAYNVAQIMEPMTLCGSIIGVFFNVIMPAYVIVVFLVVLLIVASFRTFRKVCADF